MSGHPKASQVNHYNVTVNNNTSIAILKAEAELGCSVEPRLSLPTLFQWTWNMDLTSGARFSLTEKFPPSWAHPSRTLLCDGKGAAEAPPWDSPPSQAATGRQRQLPLVYGEHSCLHPRVVTPQVRHLYKWRVSLRPAEHPASMCPE